MNMFKSNGGFTLVELIVVIAILAILAGIAVPAYSGYIDKANNAQTQINQSAAERAIKAAFAMNYVEYDEDLVTWNADKTAVTAVNHAKASDIMDSYNEFAG